MASTLTIQKQDITKMDVDCIVNAANKQLKHGSGVCGAIFSAAGATELQKACDALGMCNTGHTAVTPGFKLKAKYIIHAVGPRWQDGKHQEAEMLYSCYQSAMHDAQEHNCHSIAFPLISSGVYGYPVKEAWEIAIRSIRDYQMAHSSYPLDAVIAVIDDQALKLGSSILTRETAKHCAAKKPFVFFGHAHEENGCFSMWYPAPFVVEGIRYCHCGQYMMARKALLFGDIGIYCQILAEAEPAACKALGRSVANFNQYVWDSCKEEIIYNANYAKFSQNPKLKAALLATGDAILAEANSHDPVWGIGLSATDPESQSPAKWKGQNLLGKALMDIREKLKKLHKTMNPI